MNYNSFDLITTQIKINNSIIESFNKEYKTFTFTSEGMTYESRKAKKYRK